ncbi:MAG: hypothetical protein ABR611_08450 [Chthoniobacterales bacterium]
MASDTDALQLHQIEHEHEQDHEHDYELKGNPAGLLCAQSGATGKKQCLE